MLNLSQVFLDCRDHLWEQCSSNSYMFPALFMAFYFVTSIEFLADNKIFIYIFFPENLNFVVILACGTQCCCHILIFFPLHIMFRVGQKVCMFFFYKIQGTFFIFTNNFPDIFWVCWLSPAWCNIDYSQLSWFDRYQLQLVCQLEHSPVRNLQQEILQAAFDTID